MSRRDLGIYTVTDLPTASERTLGAIFRVRAAGADDTYHLTLRTSVGGHAWIELGDAADLAAHAALTAAHGATGAVVGTTNVQTLTGKTLTAPTIADFTNAGHDHADADDGGTIAHTALTAIGSNTHAQLDTHVAAANPHSGSQPLDGDLTTIAGLTATTDNVVQSVASAWASRTPAQLKTTLTLVKGDVGLGNVDNTSDATKDAAAATLANKTLTTPTIGSFANAGHTHTNAAGGGQITDAALSAAVGVAKGGTGATTAPAALVNLGLTATAAELNALDGITATVAELNILDGVTATAAELNALDGITATVAELNFTDGVTSAIQTQLDAMVKKAGDTMTGALIVTNSITGSQRLSLGTTSSLSGEIHLLEAGANTTTKILTGSGDPEGAVTADPGSLYLRAGGGAGATVYAKNSGFENTGWGALS